MHLPGPFGLPEHLARRSLHVRVVALIVCIDQMLVLVDDSELHRRGADIDAETKTGVAEIGTLLRLELGTLLHERHRIVGIALRLDGIAILGHSCISFFSCARSARSSRQGTPNLIFLP